MANDELTNGTVAPWWAKTRDYLFAAAFALLLLMQLGFVPSGVTKALDSMISEHGRIVHKLEVMCVHQAKDDRERRECLE